jgi:hypothetical protein
MDFGLGKIPCLGYVLSRKCFLFLYLNYQPFTPMKSIFTFCFSALILLVINANATVYTVSNVAIRPAQFTTIQAAVDSAAIGDTILITGGGAAYGSIITVKPLVYIGEGINNPSVNVSTLALNRLNSSLSSSGSKFYGINFTSSITISPSFSGSQTGQSLIENIIFERCRFDGFSLFTSQGIYRDITYRNCVFTSFSTITPSFSSSSTTTYQNFNFINCVFSGVNISSGNQVNFNGAFVIRNSIFMNRTTNLF